jgi:uncharacterized protein YjbI with pentapeptide repeats
MANPEHLKILKQGVEVWNKWRIENPKVRPDLSGLDLPMGSLKAEHINFSNTDLREVSFPYANLTYAQPL